RPSANWRSRRVWPSPPSHGECHAGTRATGGGTLRDVLEDIRAADWSRDGAQLAVVRHLNGTDRLEYPIGTVWYETTCYVRDQRIAPSGDAIAFLDHSEYGAG